MAVGNSNSTRIKSTEYNLQLYKQAIDGQAFVEESSTQEKVRTLSKIQTQLENTDNHNQVCVSFKQPNTEKVYTIRFKLVQEPSPFHSDLQHKDFHADKRLKLSRNEQLKTMPLPTFNEETASDSRTKCSDKVVEEFPLLVAGRAPIINLTEKMQKLTTAFLRGDEFVRTVYQNNLHETKRLLQTGVNPIKPHGVFGARAPCYAAKHGHTDMLQELMDSGIDPNVKETLTNRTPLYLAVENGKLDAVNTLLNFHADMEASPGEECLTPLFLAIRSGRYDIATSLLCNGANLCTVDRDKDITNLYDKFVQLKDKSPMYYAVRKGKFDFAMKMHEKLTTCQYQDLQRESHVLINGLLKAGRLEQAEKVIQRLMNNCNEESLMFNLFSCISNSNDEAVAVNFVTKFLTTESVNPNSQAQMLQIAIDNKQHQLLDTLLQHKFGEENIFCQSATNLLEVCVLRGYYWATSAILNKYPNLTNSSFGVEN